MTNLARLENIKIELKSLLVSRNSQDITLPFLNELYKDISEEDIPYTDFNYTSLKQFLASMPEVLYLKTNKKNELCVYHVETERSRHISRLVSLEKQEKPKKNRKIPFRNNVIDPSILNKILSTLCNSTLQNTKNKKIKKTDVLSSIQNEIGEYVFYTAEDLNNQLNKLNHVLYYNEDYIYFKAEYENKLKKNMSDEKKEVHVRNCIDKQIKFDSTNNNSVSDLVKESTKVQLEKLIKKYPEGIRCWELPKLYQHEYKLDLEYSDLGFNSVIEFAGALPHILKIVTHPSSGQYLLVSTEISINSSEYYQESNLTHKNESLENLHEIELHPRKLPDKIIDSLISNKFLYNEIIDQVCITSVLTNGQDEFDIIVSEVHNPSFFWIHLTKNKKMLNKLVKNLQEFYMNQHLDSYRIPSLLVRPGLHVACIFDSQWHRGIVKKIINSEETKIHFYDYGTNEIYNFEDLYFLDQQFYVIPALAIPCILHNVKPIGVNQWSSEISEKFVERVFNKQFIAHISSIDYKRNFLHINLVDISDLNCININYWMVLNKIAEWGAPIVPKTIFTLKNCKKYMQMPNLDKKEMDTNHKISTANSKINEKCSSTPNRISFAKKLEIIRKYKANILNNSLGSSFDSSQDD